MFRDSLRLRKFLFGCGMATLYYTIMTGVIYMVFEDLISSLLFVCPIAFAIVIFIFWHLRMHHGYVIAEEYPMEDGFFVACCFHSVGLTSYALLAQREPVSGYE